MKEKEKLVPSNQMEFEKMFATETQCVDYIIKLKYEKNIVICPKCNSNRTWQRKTYIFKCNACKRESSILISTIFENSKKPLTLYFRAIWYMVGQKNGTNAKDVQRILGLGSYNSAWLWLHKIRTAMVRLETEKLSGIIEIDEAFLGKSIPGKRGRGAKEIKVVVAVELGDKKLGRIRIKHIKDCSSATLHEFIKDKVEKGSKIITDDWNGYKGIEKEGYIHEVIQMETNEELPHVHLVISLLKRWLLGTMHGSYSKKYFSSYLNEFVFRFNRRTSKKRGLLFYRLMETAVKKPPLTLEKLKVKEKRVALDQK